MKTMRGYSFIEVLIVMALIGMMLLIWGGASLRATERQRDFDNFRREVVYALQRCRWKAMNERSYAGTVVEKVNGNYVADFYLDGNRNGIRLADIQSGVDATFLRSYELFKVQGDIAAGILQDEPVPEIPPKTGVLDPSGDPVKFGRSDIISFSPNGDSSSGTLYLSCRSQHQMFALVLYGATARLTVWKYSNHQWQMVGDQ
jgi:prepilin-type N-terminal cleavage/methylation domain-containing protein